MYSSNGKKNFADSLKMGKNIISDFLINLHKVYLQENKITIPEMKDITFFLNHLAKNELLPFTKKELQRYLRETKEFSSDDTMIEKRAIELYDLISEFQAKLNNFQIK